MLWRLLSAVIAAVLIGIASISLWIPILIYRPAPLTQAAPSAWGMPSARIVSVPSGRGDHLFGWWLRPPTRGAPVVLIVHGRSGNISTRASIAARLSADGFGVLLFDFRGYGRSTGQSSERTLTEDATAAYDWLRRQDVDARQIVVLGQSLGDAAAAQLTALRPVRALALVSPFTSLPGALADSVPWLPTHLLPWSQNRFEVKASIRTLRVPVLFVISRDDGIVPYANSRRLAAAARDVRWLELDGQRHNGLLAAASASGRLSQALKLLTSDTPM